MVGWKNYAESRVVLGNVPNRVLAEGSPGT